MFRLSPATTNVYTEKKLQIILFCHQRIRERCLKEAEKIQSSFESSKCRLKMLTSKKKYEKG